MVHWLFGSLGFSIRSTRHLEKIESLVERTSELTKLARVVEFLGNGSRTRQLTLGEVFGIVKKSKSQLGQDILALSLTEPEQKGFFVEFGATNGIDLSNTWLLEKDYGWSGILCEPARNWQERLRLERQASLDFRCVYSATGERVSFTEVSSGELSTISDFAGQDGHGQFRQQVSNRYTVETVSLFDLLRDHGAPKFIDFLSIDTEGSEYEILRAFDFDSYSFGLIAVEHNYTKNQSLISQLLTSKGYRQIFPELSEFDDWYIGSH